MDATDSENDYMPSSVRDCFRFDHHKYNPTPKGFIRKAIRLKLSFRYSMSVYLRLSQYFWTKSMYGEKPVYRYLAYYFRRKNQILNNFEYDFDSKIYRGTLFHHPGVIMTGGSVMERGVEVFARVTLAKKDGKAPTIRANTILFSHVIILGGVEVGPNSVVGAGAVVNRDIPSDSIAAGVPARVIGPCKEARSYLEYR